MFVDQRDNTGVTSLVGIASRSPEHHAERSKDTQTRTQRSKNNRATRRASPSAATLPPPLRRPVRTMTDDRPHVPRVKGRSASICAANHAASMEAIPPSGASPDAGTPQTRRRRPAARSQSARLTNKRSVRSRHGAAAAASAAAAAAPGLRSQSNSEPKLADQDTTPDVSPNIRRKGSQRRGTSVYQRKSAAFLDVPDARGRSNSNTEEEDEDSYRLRSFSFTSKGESGARNPFGGDGVSERLSKLIGFLCESW
ncbi:hypothetical protein NQ318_020598 [Aromia moschata]|uniref:Uncharacterized protein n=1 Tax=Aromia moschata TaxID=1265417 RepID=A0AAV8Z2S3_9CUCU|nr:hypothetical protein NQ318_020598 [Aromia moschata]